MILSDKEINSYALNQGMISPFVDHQVKEKNGRRVVSYGLSSYGYDIRLGREFKFFSPGEGKIIDPKNFDSDLTENLTWNHETDGVIVPPYGSVLSVSIEKFSMPENVMGQCLGKSTYARSGIVVHVTPLEPGWIGYLTLEFSNNTPLPVKVYPEEGIAQLVFFRGEKPGTTYADRSGKYQNASGLETPKS